MSPAGFALQIITSRGGYAAHVREADAPICNLTANGPREPARPLSPLTWSHLLAAHLSAAACASIGGRDWALAWICLANAAACVAILVE